MRPLPVTAAAGVLALVAAGLAGCSRSTTVAADYLQVVRPTRSLPSTGGGDIERSFVTPHFSVRQDQVAVATTIPADTAEKFGLDGDGDLEAPAGHELVLATLRGKGGGLYPDADVAPVVSVRAGDGEAALDAWPDRFSLGGVAVAAVVERGAAVTLEVVDDGRTVTWDLRTGDYADDPVSQASAVLADDASVAEDLGGTKTVTGQANLPGVVAGVPARVVSVEVRLDTTKADARVTPWLSGPGWAPDGSVWLYVTGMRLSYRGTGLLTSTVAEPAAAFTVTPAGGAAVAAFGAGVTTSSSTVDIDGSEVAFKVPADFSGATLAFAPQATLKAITVVGGAADVTWVTRPPAASVALDLAG